MTELDFIHKSLEIKSPPDFTVVSTFSGGGGSSTGYVWAGGKVLLAVEWDNNAVETYRLNYPSTDIYHGDIAKLSVEEVLRRTGLKPGELDIFDGSPPCQGFSTAGKRMVDDPRNQLFREYARLLRGLKPKVFVMENVSGMVKGKMKLLFVEILQELKAVGYRVSAKLLNAKYLGVPQSRERVIFIGVRDDLGIEPSHPKPRTIPITAGHALNGVLSKTLGIYSSNVSAQRIKSNIHRLKPGQQYSQIESSGFNMWRLSNNKPSGTVPKTVILSGLACGIIHPVEHRLLSIEELKRIGSYPDCYQFVGKFEEQWARIGNSVPPRMMQYIAEHIKTEILSKIE